MNESEKEKNRIRNGQPGSGKGARAKYEDIIDLPRHRSVKRAPMPADKRAAQFAPFAALTGFGEMIEAANRQADEKE